VPWRDRCTRAHERSSRRARCRRLRAEARFRCRLPSPGPWRAVRRERDHHRPQPGGCEGAVLIAVDLDTHGAASPEPARQSRRRSKASLMRLRGSRLASLATQISRAARVASLRLGAGPIRRANLVPVSSTCARHHFFFAPARTPCQRESFALASCPASAPSTIPPPNAGCRPRPAMHLPWPNSSPLLASPIVWLTARQARAGKLIDQLSRSMSPPDAEILGREDVADALGTSLIECFRQGRWARQTSATNERVGGTFRAMGRANPSAPPRPVCRSSAHSFPCHPSPAWPRASRGSSGQARDRTRTRPRRPAPRAQ
jgi:hypothetical protein